jgi:hypothetical protein
MQNTSNTFAHDSMLGGLNLLKHDSTKMVLSKGQRPPYPIITSNASPSDVFWNLNRADLSILAASVPLGFFTSLSCVKFLKGNEHVRRRVFSAVFTYVLFTGGFMAMNNSAYRLAGLVDNGLSWKRKT